MPWYPKAVRKQLTYPNRARNKIRMDNPVRINHHTAVSNSGSLYGFFNSAGANGVFSHFYVTKTGGVEQYQDTDYRASCDLDGNPDTISVETWDGYRSGYPGYWLYDSDVPPWNDAQMAALIELDRWILANHPTIPRRLARDNRKGPSSHGLSWHRLGVVGAPGFISRTDGGLTYSLARGKICPGPRRIAQIPQILSALNAGLPPAGVSNTPTPPPDTRTDLERLLDSMDEAELRKIIREETHHGAFSAIRSNTEHLKGIVYVSSAKLAADRAPLEDAARQRAALEGVTTALRTELDARQVPDADAIAKSVAAVLVDGVDVTVTAKG